MSLRPYQAVAVDQLEDGDLLVSPTGTGKARMLAEVARREVDGGGVPLVVAHRAELIHQLSNTLRDAWLTPEINCWVRTIQELRKNGGPRASLLLWDEAHHSVSDDWVQLKTKQYPNAKLVGATATPERGDGRGLGGLFKRIVTTISVREAIAQGFLVQPTVLRPDRLLGPGELAQDPVQAYLDHAKGTKAISFFPTVQLAVQAACRFRDAGVTAAAVFGDMPIEHRRKTIQLFALGAIQVLTSVNVLTEGFDVPDVETCILARGFGTAGAFIQAVGRVLRPAPGKTRALVLDLRGCSHEHGEPEDERTYHLEGRGIRRAGDEIDVRFCPVCGAPVTNSACEQCGHSGEMRMRPPRVLGLPIDRFARKRAENEDDQAKTFARWLQEARNKGWKNGHAFHRFKAVYGAPPSRAVQQAAMRILAG